MKANWDRPELENEIAALLASASIPHGQACLWLSLGLFNILVYS